MTTIPGNGERPDEYTMRSLVFDDEYRVRPEFKRRHQHMAELRCHRRSRHLVGVAVRFPQWGTWVAVRDTGDGRVAIAAGLGQFFLNGGWGQAMWLDPGRFLEFRPCMCSCARWTVSLEWLAMQHGVVLTSAMPVLYPWRDLPADETV